MESGPPFIANFPDQRKDLFAYDLLVIGDVDANLEAKVDALSAHESAAHPLRVPSGPGWFRCVPPV